MSQINLFANYKNCETTGIEPANGKTLPRVEFWLKCFIESDYVITDSYHGMAFSIIMHKPFFVFLNNLRGSNRMSELLEMLGISERIIDSNVDINWELYDKQIDWEAVDRKIAAYKQFSTNWLLSAINS